MHNIHNWSQILVRISLMMTQEEAALAASSLELTASQDTRLFMNVFM